ncbi:protein SRC2 homolog [Elaeis guineensis]|uniref:protein SRC2 homolog n=1 Tax=Elaeis guineensis var. tenera TaxID=51953 RepID=UPI003C6CE611
MACSKLKVTLNSAKDLQKVHLFSKMQVYAEVWLSGDRGSRQQTPSDRKGDRNPTWNSTICFHIPADNNGRQVLHILLRAECALGDDRDVGEVRIPLSELLDAAAGNEPKSVSYPVCKCTSGKTKGTLNLSYKVGKKITGPAPAPPSAPLHSSGVPTSDQPVLAHPPYGAQPYPPPPPHGYVPPPHQATYGYPPVVYLYAPAVQPPKKNEFVVHIVTTVCSVGPPTP